MEEYSNTLLNLIKEKKTGNRFLFGIDGLSRSGKTTLTKKFCGLLKENNIPHSVFHIDDHIVTRKDRYNTGRDEWFEYYFLQWDLHEIRQHFFENLILSRKFDLNFYDNETDTHSPKTIELPDDCIIVVEGVFLQRQEWRDYFDYVVFLDCPRDIRFDRESDEAQQLLDKFEKRYWKAEEFYQKAVSPKQKADLVLHG
ncbi:kinase [Bacillus sp. AK031]